VCCQIGGVPPNPPAGVFYPAHWFDFLSGEKFKNQQLCPFLFQYFGEPRFFCAIHNIKPISCRVFEREDCRKRLSDRGLHGS
jgi:Fe-S-cluster containining protein